MVVPYIGAGFQRRSRLGCPRAVGKRRRRRRWEPVRTGAALHHAPLSPAAFAGDRRPHLLCRTPGPLLHHVLHGGRGVQVKSGECVSLTSLRKRASFLACRATFCPFSACTLFSSLLGRASRVFMCPPGPLLSKVWDLRLGLVAWGPPGDTTYLVLASFARFFGCVWVATLASAFMHVHVSC